MPRRSKRNQWWDIKAVAGSDTVEVLIYGDIGESLWGDSVSAREFVEELQGLNDKDLLIRINSFGGSVSDGLAIYNAIKAHPRSKETIIDGVAMSMASLIALAGDKVRMAANGMYMIHAPFGVAIGNASRVRKYADVLDRFARNMATSYADRTGQTPDEFFDEYLAGDEDHYFSAQEALEAGFIDEISGAAEEKEVARYRAAAFDRFNVPAAIAAAYNPKEIDMPKKTGPAANPNPAPAPDNPTNPEPPSNVTDIETAAEARERARLQARNQEITEAFTPFLGREGFSALHAECIGDIAMSAEQARARLLAELGKGSAPVGGNRVESLDDERDKLRAAARDALLVRAGVHRMSGNGVAALQIDMNGNPMRGYSLVDIARACLRMSGTNPDGMERREIVSAAFQTSGDFAVLLENVLHKTLQQAYATAEDTWSRFCATGSLSDFRPHNRYRSGSLGNLEPVNEHGEFKNKAIPDGEKGTISAGTKGNIISVTRQAIINDDLGSLTSMAQMAGRAARRTIEADVYALLALNGGLGPTLLDGLTLFHADHGNITDAAALSMAAIDADRVAMASQKGVGGHDYLDLRPSALVISIALGGAARTINEAQYDPDTANKLQRPNMVRGLFRDVVDTPRITGTRRYLFADPSDAPVIEVGFLDGREEPYLETRDGWTVDGAELKVRIDYGVAAIDYRGAVTNAGA